MSAAWIIPLDVLENAWGVYLLLAPLFLIGLSIAGILHVLLTQATIKRMLGQEGLKSILTAAAFGLPLPICSCGVIPIAAFLHKKGASRSACMSFLITTPETGVDSILVTWGLMGPIMAIVRPIGAFFSALLAGICTIVLLPSRSPNNKKEDDCCDVSGCNLEVDAAVIGLHGLRRSFRASTTNVLHRGIRYARKEKWSRPTLHPQEIPSVLDTSDAVPLRFIGKRIFDFAFVEMADDILFALVVGVLLSGVVMVVLPNDLADYGLSGWRMYAVMLLAGVPLYMCASASTPVAAALVAKGISPGAALVFLMTGPATNSATIVMLYQQFGARFVSFYLSGIVVGAVTMGVMIDATLVFLSWEIVLNLDGSTSNLIGFIEWTGAILLLALIAWRFRKGAATAGYRDLMGNIRSFVLGIARLR